MKYLHGIGFTIALLIFGLYLLEALSIQPAYKYEQATILKIQPVSNWVSFDGSRTLVRFKDGYTMSIIGERGFPGDAILAERPDGTQSAFGIIGDRRMHIGAQQ